MSEKLPKYQNSENKRLVKTKTPYLSWDKKKQTFAYYRHNPQGGVIYRSLATTSESEAKEKWNEVHAEVEEKLKAKAALAASKSFAYYEEKFFADCERRRKFEGQEEGICEKQVVTYRRLARHLNEKVPNLASTKIALITIDDLNKWTDDWRRDWSKDHFNKLHTLLKKIFEFAQHDREITIDANPMNEFRRSTKHRPEKATPTFEQFEEIIEFIRNGKYEIPDARNLLCGRTKKGKVLRRSGGPASIGYRNAFKNQVIDWIEFAAFTGLRPGAINSLKKSDVKVDEASRRFFVELRERSKNWHSVSHPYYLCDEAAEVVKRLLQNYPETEDLLPVKHPSVTLRFVCKKLRFPNFTPNSFRHFYVTNAHRNGIPLKTIGVSVGHSRNSDISGKVYTHVQRDDLIDASKKIHFRQPKDATSVSGAPDSSSLVQALLKLSPDQRAQLLQQAEDLANMKSPPTASSPGRQTANVVAVPIPQKAAATN